MDILLIGSGGREHALAWKLQQSPDVNIIYCAPGNPGIAGLSKVEIVDIKADNLGELLNFARKKKIGLTVVGPEDPLAAGIVDLFRHAGLAIFGPTKLATMLESSKSWSKKLMVMAGIPTARHETFNKIQNALDYVRKNEAEIFPCFVKASGLAAGKGAIPCRTRKEAEVAIHDLMIGGKCGGAGNTIVIEDWLVGPEVSVHAFCDATSFRLCPVTRDHKYALEGDGGEMTGGMGTVGPITTDYTENIERIVRRTLLAIEGLGTPFTGMLFPGLILTADGPKVLEFNCRFGDPETQSLMRLLDCDLAKLLLACAQNCLEDIEKPVWRSGKVATVILASGGYPGSYEKGKIISGLDAAGEVEGVEIFHCGTAQSGEGIVTAGGRVLAVSCLRENLSEALAGAYAAAGLIKFEGKYLRTDIGASTLATM